MKEIVIVSQNRPGLIADISEALGSRNINIETLDAEGIFGTAVVELTVDRYDEALQALRDRGFDAISEDALVVRLPDEPGALAKVAKRFREQNIGLRSVRILRREQGVALVAIGAERTHQVRKLLEDLPIVR